jgi:hypothetical protein
MAAAIVLMALETIVRRGEMLPRGASAALVVAGVWLLLA